MKVAFYTLGCKVNQNDTQGLMDLFQKQGYEVIPFQGGADVYVINTCAVTMVGEQKSRQIIRKTLNFNPQAVMVVTGCYAQTSPQIIAGIPGVNLVVGIADRPRILELVQQFMIDYRNQINVSRIDGIDEWIDLPLSEPAERTRAMLKIEDGCEEFCSYCIVPYARGKVRSMPMKQVVEKFNALQQKGYREIVLTGIHLGQYGREQGTSLHHLLIEILKRVDGCRIRLGSLEPNDLPDDLLNLVLNNPAICQHLHIPLQSGCDRILKLMNRHYNSGFVADLLARIREKNPLIAIGTDLIVGFPGETEADFIITRDFVQKQNFSRIHVFRFSPRRGTAAAELPDRVSKSVQEERSKIIQQIATQAAQVYTQKFIEKNVEVLFEKKIVGGWTGLTGEYLRMRTDTKLDFKNCLQKVKVIGLIGDGLSGTDILE